MKGHPFSGVVLVFYSLACAVAAFPGKNEEDD